MTAPEQRRYVVTAALAATVAALVGACGDDDKETSSKVSTLSVTTTDLGKKKFRMEAPKSIEGGLVEVKLRNAGKIKHEAQVLHLGDHSVKEALKIISADRPASPAWLFAEGGVAGTAPGKTGTATIKLTPGNYAVIDFETDNRPGPPPALFGATATFKVTGDNGGKLKDTDAKIAAKDVGRDRFEWAASNLKPGRNEVTFDNTKSKEIHLVLAAPILGKATLADVKAFLAQQGKPSGPPPIDFAKAAKTTILDGKRKQRTELKLGKGRTALICYLPDRDGKGKPHYEEGMLKEVDLR